MVRTVRTHLDDILKLHCVLDLNSIIQYDYMQTTNRLAGCWRIL